MFGVSGNNQQYRSIFIMILHSLCAKRSFIFVFNSALFVISGICYSKPYYFTEYLCQESDYYVSGYGGVYSYSSNSIEKSQTNIFAGDIVTIDNGRTVAYSAPTITLEPGFRAEAGSKFTAKSLIVDCINGTPIYDFQYYSEGDIIHDLGTNNIVINAPQGLALSSGNGNPTNITISDLKLLGDIEFKVDMDLSAFDSRIIFWDGVKQVLQMSFVDDIITFGKFSDNWGNAHWEGDTNKNEVTIVLFEDVAIAYINNHLFASTAITTNNFNRVEVTNIDRNSASKDYIYYLGFEEFLSPLQEMSLDTRSVDFSAFI
jgi:hypothetical protein